MLANKFLSFLFIIVIWPALRQGLSSANAQYALHFVMDHSIFIISCFYMSGPQSVSV